MPTQKTEDDTFNALKRVPFPEVAKLFGETPGGWTRQQNEEFLKQHDWTLDDFLAEAKKHRRIVSFDYYQSIRIDDEEN